jgi:hypothetical protein
MSAFGDKADINIIDLREYGADDARSSTQGRSGDPASCLYRDDSVLAWHRAASCAEGDRPSLSHRLDLGHAYGDRKRERILDSPDPCLGSMESDPSAFDFYPSRATAWGHARTASQRSTPSLVDDHTFRGRVGDCRYFHVRPRSHHVFSSNRRLKPTRHLLVPIASTVTPLPGSRQSSNYLKRRLARENWLIEAQPISFIPRSISARRRPRARSTPACPAAAKG